MCDNLDGPAKAEAAYARPPFPLLQSAEQVHNTIHPNCNAHLFGAIQKKNVVRWEHGDGWAKSSKAVSMEKSLGLGLEAPVRDVATPRWCFELRYACGSQCDTGRVLRTRPPTRPRRNRNLEYAQVPFNAQPVPLGTW